MTKCVSYNGKEIGEIKIDFTGEIFFVTKDLEALALIFKMKPEDKIEVEKRIMDFETFKKDYLGKISAFYSTERDYQLRGRFSNGMREFKRG